MRVLLALVFILGVAQVAFAADYMYNGHLYTEVTGNWFTAEQNAESWGGKLVTINDQAEQNWLIQTFGTSEYFWTGFTDRANEGQWSWVSGEPVTYTNWASGEPNDFLGLLGEDYAVMNWRAGGKWNDAWPILISNVGIAEKVAAEPFSCLLFGMGGVALALVRRKKRS